MHGGRPLAALVAVLCLALSLAACGGGGGGGAPTAANPTPAPEENPTPIDGALDADGIRNADRAKTGDATDRAATALPRFGSVTQSTNVDASGITTDRAGAAFDGTGLTVKIARADASTLTLDTADAVEESTPGAGRRVCTRYCSLGSFAEYTTVDHSPFSIPGGERTAGGWETLNVSDSAATVAHLAVTSADGDSSDWLAAGSWLHVAGRNLLSTAPTVTSAETGAFVDGPELRTPPDLPATGTARYEGWSGGSYVTRGASGNTDVGTFEGVVTLTADFADDTIRGCIGCKRNLLLSGVATDAETGAQEAHDKVPTDYQIRLGAAQVGSDGTFRASDVTLFSATVQQAGLGVTEQSGSWGGRFSNIPDGAGDPRLAAGTAGGKVTYSDGTQSRYIGAFAAGKLASPETPTVPDWLWLPSADGARSRIGGEPLDLTSQQIIDRAGRLLQAASIRLIREEFTNTGAEDVRCDGVVCRWGGYFGDEERLALEVGGEWRPVMRHRGVDLAQGRGRVTGENAYSWGEYVGVMEHGQFGLTRLDRDAPSGSWSTFPYAFGNAPETNPGADLGTAAWNGVMMGFDSSGAAPGTIQGDAAITVDLGRFSSTVDVAFTNVRNLDTGAAARDMRWNDLRLRDGGFEDGYILGDNYIKGAFFGPQHQEVGGVFKRDLYAGSFGAKR